MKKYTHEETLFAIERTQIILGNLHQHVIEMSNPEPDTDYLDNSYDWMQDLIDEWLSDGDKPEFSIMFKDKEHVLKFSFTIEFYERKDTTE